MADISYVWFRRGSCLLYFLIFTLHPLIAQDSGLPLGHDAYHIYDRLSIKTGLSSPIHSSLKGYARKPLVEYAIAVDTALLRLSIKDRRDLYYLFKDNNEWLAQAEQPTTLTGPQHPVYQEAYADSSGMLYRRLGSQVIASEESDRYILSKKPLWKHFYRTPANLFELTRKGFYLKLNPMLNFSMGRQNDGDLIFHNQRGVEVRGGIDDRIFFYTNILESQSRFPDYINERIIRDGALPGAGLIKNYNSSVLDITDGYDYLISQGYVGFNISRHVSMQLGHGNHFIGNGYRSLLLSDFAANYFYLKLNTQVWKFHYQNLFVELGAESHRNRSGDRLLSKKYMAAHYLSYQITPKLNIGLFEAVVFSRNNNFELQYLNPLIFYRTVEGFIGSPDNVLIGADGSWNLFNRIQLYGQLILDEFKFDELLVERRGWWANKLGIQAGIKYIDAFGIDHLDAQMEFNTVRPYTYTHRDSSSSYAHLDQPLAHPIGANFRELIFKARYQASKRIAADFRLIAGNFGEDGDTTNWGTNILVPSTTREQDFGNEIGQGTSTNTLLAGIDLSYQLFHNMYVDLHYFYRRQDSENPARDFTNSYFGAGVRINMARRRLDF
ncbi:MAG: hypothetical protein AAGG75_18030 [Bacteroidota bacterium]